MPNGEPQLTGVAIKNAAIARAPTVGQRKFLFRLSTDVLPQHSNGPTAVSNSTSNATGIMTRLKKGGPTVILCHWTQSERIGQNVPKIDSMNVAKISHIFQTFSMPRFSCIMTECRNAVPVSQGKNEAFSTGSQPQ